MPRTCRACSSPNRTAIDTAIATGEPLRNIAERVSISPTSLLRHKVHVGEAIQRAGERREERYEDGLLGKIERVQAKLWEVLARMESEGDHRGSVVALREIRESLETIDRVGTRANGSPSEHALHLEIAERLREGLKRVAEAQAKESVRDATGAQ